MSHTDRVVRDGKVAVLVSPGYGAGWHTWGDNKYGERLLFDPGLVALVEGKASGSELVDYVAREFPDVYTGGVEDLEVRWVPEGSRFRIDEYDGFESLVLLDEDDFHVA